MEANMMFWKDSQPHTLAGHPEKFPNQKIPINDLLYIRSSENLLMKTCEDRMVRYFHLPANNVSWAEVWESLIPLICPINQHFIDCYCSSLQ
jgi:hypothetical protein